MSRAHQVASIKGPRTTVDGIDDHPIVGKFALIPTSALTPDPRNARKHTREQIRAIARSIEAFGFNAPILIDKDKQIIVGEGRYEAAKFLGRAEVPVIGLDHLSKTQARAYMLADNKLSERSSKRWPMEESRLASVALVPLPLW